MKFAHGGFGVAFLMLAPCTMVIPVYSLQAQWISLPLTPDQRVNPRRSGHTAFVKADSTPYVFGGYAEDDDNDANVEARPLYKRYVVNDLWKWKGSAGAGGDVDILGDETDQTPGWSLVDTQGDAPGPRLVTASAVHGDKAYLFGGWDPETAGTGGVILDTVHELDMTTATWKALSCCMPDGPTSRHVAVALKTSGDDSTTNTILLHTHRCLDYVLLYDTTTQTFTKQATTGPCPSPRGLHCAALVNDHTVCVFGGAAQDQTMSNECFLLDTTSWTWTKVLNDNDDDNEARPTPRAGASLVAMESINCVLLFGGAEATATGLNPRSDVWALSLDDDTLAPKWTLLINDDNDDSDRNGRHRPPPRRNAATLSHIPSGGASAHSDDHADFLLTGGWAPFRQTWDDCYVLRVSNK
jgi:Kelch motif/Galactose oxidase, central domain